MGMCIIHNIIFLIKSNFEILREKHKHCMVKLVKVRNLILFLIQTSFGTVNSYNTKLSISII